MSEQEQARQRLLAKLSRSLVYTTPLLVAVTGAAAVHGIISDMTTERGPAATQAAPEHTSNTETNSEAVPEANPEAMPEATPEASPEAMPEAIPEATGEADANSE
ncbi:MAG: hypothetical protein RI539_00285 [Spiribacter sp.]|jgi:hypothetical protein|nr:hypothetical protein [Spiribacter sp.]MDR9488762.1 hypothetical protein [Spiribacter sp.]